MHIFGFSWECKIPIWQEYGFHVTDKTKIFKLTFINEYNFNNLINVFKREISICKLILKVTIEIVKLMILYVMNGETDV